MNNQENADSFKTGDRPVESPQNEVVYADFSEMAIDTEYQKEALAICKEFEKSDWEALQLSEI